MHAFFVMLALLALPVTASGEVLSPVEASSEAADGNLTIVDVRMPSEWAETGLPEGALGVSLQNPETFVEDLLQALDGDPERPIGLICARGNRSALAAQLLTEAGFTNVHDISEGMVGGANGPGWLERDLPTEPCKTC